MQLFLIYYLLDPTTVAATAISLLPIPGYVVGLRGEISKIACLISKTSATKAKTIMQNLSRNGKTEKNFLQNRASID